MTAGRQWLHGLWLWAGAFAIQIPFLRRGVSHLDEGLVLAIADGLSQGETLYGERLTPFAPLVFEVLARLFDVFGTSLLVGRVFQAGIFATTIVLVYAILRQAVPVRWALLGAAAALCLKPLGFPFWTVVNYSQLAMLFCLGAVLATTRYLALRSSSWMLAAGLLCGLTVITKQNLGASAVVVVAFLVAFDGLGWSARDWGRLARSGAAFGLGVGVPILFTVGYYASAGTLGGLVERAVLGVLELPGPYRNVPLPSLLPFGTESIGRAAFTYFPAPILSLSWQGGLNLYSAPIVFVLEHAVKLVYYVPLALLVVSLVSIARSPRDASTRGELAVRGALLAFGAMAYTSMWYAPDWTHLLNVYPLLLLPMFEGIHRGWKRSALYRGLASGLGFVWVGFAVWVAIAVFAVYRVPVDSARGRVLLSALEQEEAARLLAYLASRPRDERILIFPRQPIFYFLGDRRIPVSFEQIMPGVLLPGDDEVLARQMSGVDRFVYNPKKLPNAPASIVDYAPALAATLVRDFEVARVVSPSAIVLGRRGSARRPEMAVRDLWERFGELEVEPSRPLKRPPPYGWPQSVERNAWMMYRVIATTLERDSGPACFRVSHQVGARESIRFLPLLHMDLWGAGEGTGPQSAATFEVEVRSARTPSARLFSRVLEPGAPLGPAVVDLTSLAGRDVEFGFCVEVQGSAGDPPLATGWGELRIARDPMHIE